jgi:hypothetical protein
MPEKCLEVMSYLGLEKDIEEIGDAILDVARARP